LAIVAAGVSRRRFAVILTLSALAMCALSVASTSIAWTP
jgi:lipopolysaccharide export LptBFGC system permease protein LptF